MTRKDLIPPHANTAAAPPPGAGTVVGRVSVTWADGQGQHAAVGRSDTPVPISQVGPGAHSPPRHRHAL